MDFVKIRGKDMQDCLMQMKMKYGSEAHIYDQRILREGGVMGTGLFAKEIYEIEVGIPEKQVSKERVDKKIQNLKELLRQKSVEKKSSVKSIKEDGDFVSIAEFSDSAYGETKPETMKIVQRSEVERKNLGLSLQEEIVRKRTYPAILPEKNSTLQRFEERLIAEGMSAGYVSEFINKLDENLPAVDKNRLSAVYEKAKELLQERVQIDDNLLKLSGKKKRKVMFFIGPTGSGKTTTIAKLAAKYYLHMGKSVSLYTTDNYRIAAIEQLKRYADTMDIPFYAAKDVAKLREALTRDGSELILIDTAGFSHKNPEFFEKMMNFQSALGENDQLENILVLSSTTSYHNTKSVINAYEVLDYKRIILTKVDEAEFLGGILELADSYSKVLSFFSTGQEVPFDIISADKKILAECIIHPDKIKELKGEVFAPAL